MPTEPPVKRAIALVDGQNLYHRAKLVFGYTYPNYDVCALASTVCQQRGFEATQVRFYTGVPGQQADPLWHGFWANKLAAMRRSGVHVFSRVLHYRWQTIELPDGSATRQRIGHEKGIDVRIALDVLRLGMRAEYDVAVVFSQDQDLSEVADEVRTIAVEQGRWVKIASAFPVSSTSPYNIGVDRTDWIPIDQATYDTCIDPADYRPRRPARTPWASHGR